MREVEALCAGCDHPATTRFPLGSDVIRCASCGLETAIVRRPALDAGNPLEACALCDCPKVYIQKDFNRNVGLLLVAVTALISGVVLMITHSTLWAMGVLMVATLCDAVVYGMLPMVTVCYRCDAVHRGFPVNPAHEGFDIHIAEEFAYGKE